MITIKTKPLKSSYEIIHYADDNTIISSKRHRIKIETFDQEHILHLPETRYIQCLSYSRLLRRLLRLDKCNVVPIGTPIKSLVIIRQGHVFHYSLDTKILKETLKLSQCRNIMHQSLLKVDDRTLIFGEYGSNPDRSEVPVYKSNDGGQSWTIVYQFPKGKIRHIHGCYWDKYEEKVWIFTGDFKGECLAINTDINFNTATFLGDGTQQWRTINAFFEKDYIYWGMDSELEKSYMMEYNRHTKTLRKMTLFQGPIWYLKRTTDGVYLASTSNEVGPGVLDNYAYVYASLDCMNWDPILKFKKDLFPKNYFKYGSISFPDGPQSSKKFYISGEGLYKLDGKSFECQIY